MDLFALTLLFHQLFDYLDQLWLGAFILSGLPAPARARFAAILRGMSGWTNLRGRDTIAIEMTLSLHLRNFDLINLIGSIFKRG